MISARENFRYLVDRQLGGPGLTREKRLADALLARRCRNFFFSAVGPTVFGASTPADIIVQAQTQQFGAPMIITDILNFDEPYKVNPYPTFLLMRLFTSGVGFQEDFFGVGSFINSAMALEHCHSFIGVNRDTPSLKMHFTPYLMPPGQIFQASWEVLDLASFNGAIAVFGITAGGAGYTVGDVLTLVGGDNAAQVEVLTVDGAGAVTGIQLINPGANYTVAVFPTTGGTGAGATIHASTVTSGGRTAYNPEADFRAVQVLNAADPYGQLCGRLKSQVCNYIKGYDSETFILDLEIPTANLPAATATIAYTTPLQERPLLIYGIATNINGAQIALRDPSVQWDFAIDPKPPTIAINNGAVVPGAYPALRGVPINVLCGNGDLTMHEAYHMLPVPHLLEPNTGLTVKLTNGLRPTGVGGAYAQSIDTNNNQGHSTGNGHIAFLCRTV